MFLRKTASSKSPTPAPTTREVILSNLDWIKPNGTFILNDPYAKFTAEVEFTVGDRYNLLSDDSLLSCSSCFQWFIKEINGTNSTTILNDISDSTVVSILNQLTAVDDNSASYTSTLSIVSIRTLYFSQCVNESLVDVHLLKPGKQYELGFALKSSSEIAQKRVFAIEENRTFSVNTLPYGGNCSLLESNVGILEPFHLMCNGWMDDDGYAVNITYNALYESVMMSDVFVRNASSLTGLSTFGTETIVAMIKDMVGGITCQSFYVAFGTISNINTADIIESIIEIISGDSSATDETIGTDSGQVVAIYSVITELYTQNLTTVEETSVIVTTVTEAVISSGIIGSTISDGTVNVNTSTVSSTDLTNEFSSMEILISSQELVSDTLALNITEEYLSNSLTVVTAVDVTDSDGNTADDTTYFTIVDTYNEIVNNLAVIVADMKPNEDITQDDINSAVDKLQSSSTLAASVLFLCEFYLFIYIIFLFKGCFECIRSWRSL